MSEQPFLDERVIDADFPEVEVTPEMIERAKGYASIYPTRDMRVATGRIYTTEEMRKRREQEHQWR